MATLYTHREVLVKPLNLARYQASLSAHLDVGDQLWCVIILLRVR